MYSFSVLGLGFIALVGGIQLTGHAVAAPAPGGPDAAIIEAKVSDLDVTLRTAAEPFETLAETAMDATPAAREQAVLAATRAATTLGARSPEVSARLRNHLAVMRAAQVDGNGLALALEAIEAYRILVSAVPEDSKVPNAVDLMDYAGLRYAAALRASPPLWDDMGRSAAFARARWIELLPRVARTDLTTATERAVVDMKAAAADQDAPRSAAAVKRELDLVDELEKIF